MPEDHASASACTHHSLGFVHQQKSAGVSVRMSMAALANASGIAWYGKPTRDGSCQCGTLIQPVWSFTDEAPDCDADCPEDRWITMFRDPWEHALRLPHYACLAPALLHAGLLNRPFCM